MHNDIANDFKKMIAVLPLEMLEDLQEFLREKPGAWRDKALDVLDVEILNRKGGCTIWNSETGGLGCE